MSNYKTHYQSNMPRVKYVLNEQETEALKAIGKELAKELRKVVPVASKRAKKQIGYWLHKKTKSVQVGVGKIGRAHV